MQLIKLNTAVKPKPTQAEILEALTTVKMEELNASREQLEKEAKLLQASAEADMVEFCRLNFAKLSKKASFGYSVSNGKIEVLKNVYIELELQHAVIPPSIRAKIIKANDARDLVPRPAVRDSIRKQIKNQIAAFRTDESRLKTLVESPETRKALEQTLVSLALSAPRKS